MQFPHIDPVFLRLGPLEFRWYGLMYILSFIAAYFLIRSGVRRKKLPLSQDDVADLIFVLALGVILGGRFGYVLFYNLGYYISQPLKIFAVWEGGMSFHGGFLGVICSAIWYSRKKRIAFLELTDLCIVTVPIGLGLGRLGNFINGELYGRVTSVPWGVIFPGGGPLPRHPSQLYEAILEGPLIFSVLWLLRKKELPAGVMFWTFIAMYGAARSFVELFREPDTQIGYLFGMLSMGQVLSLPMLLIGMAMVGVALRKGKKES